MATQINLLKAEALDQILIDMQVEVQAAAGSANAAALERVAAEDAESGAESARDLAETYAGVDHRAATWAALSAISGLTGDIGYVGPDDTGSHTDPVATGTVPNEGIYKWEADGIGSAQAKRTGSTGAGLKVDRSELDALFGRQNASRGTPSPASGNSDYAPAAMLLDAAPITVASVIGEIVVQAAKDGVVALQVIRPASAAAPGVAFTRITRREFDVKAGPNTINFLDDPIDVQAGDLVGFSGPSVLRRTTGTTGFTHYDETDAASGTLGATTSAQRIEFSIKTWLNYATGNFLADQVDTNKAGIAENAARFDAIAGHVQDIAVGRTDTDGTTTFGGSATFLSTTAVEGSGQVKTLKFWSAIATDSAVRVQVYRPAVLPAAPGGAATRVVDQVIEGVEVGYNTLVPSPAIALQEGDLIGVSAPGAIRSTSPSGYPSSIYNVSNASVTLPNPTVSQEWHFGFDIDVDYSSDLPLVRDVATLKAAGSDASLSWEPTRQYIIVWGVGQSNMAGRGVIPSKFTIDTNRSYKFDGNTDTLVTLVDPCGTDGTAISGDKTSVGPAKAQAVLEATKGRVGVIFVNSSLGGTAISGWETGGTRLNNAIDQFELAVAQINSLKLDVIGCIGVFMQGESDGANATPPAAYKASFLSMLSGMQTATGMDDFKVIIAQTGVDGADPTNTDWAAIRNAQAELARDNANILMAHSGAKYFDERGIMVDTLHYNATGLDEIGGALGAAVAAYGIGSRPTGLTE